MIALDLIYSPSFSLNFHLKKQMPYPQLESNKDYSPIWGPKLKLPKECLVQGILEITFGMLRSFVWKSQFNLELVF
jgi:hypothetical protein